MISDEMLAAAMRAFEPLSSVLRHREKDQGGWHACDKLAMRAALAAVLPALMAEERERCAKVAEGQPTTVWKGHVTEVTAYGMAKRDIAAAIRALGDAP